MIDEEQKAWDVFAAAALAGLISKFGNYEFAVFSKESAEYADAMMEQRKARMG